MSDIDAVQFADYGPPEVLKMNRVPAPVPGAGEVLIEVHAATVNPIDWKIRSGMMSKVFPAVLPMTTGRDGSGVVIGVGGGVDGALVGQRVCFLCSRGIGSFAEQIVLAAPLAVPIPDALSFEDAAALPLAGLSAYAALVTAAQIKSGQRVLVHAAAGGVGTMAVQIARDIGATVIATCSARNVDFVRSLGADQVIAYDKEAFDDKLSDVDVVFDTMGGDTHRRSYKVLRKGGTMTCLSAEPFEDQSQQYGVTVKMAQVLPDGVALAHLVALASAGNLKPVVERTLPFADFVRAHELSQTGRARGKTVVQVK